MKQDIQKGLETFSLGIKSRVPIFELHRRWSDTIDRFVEERFASAAANSSNIAILALGGYGRREMSPYSDVDLLFLYAGDINNVKPVVDAVLYPLWDAGLEAGGATRTVHDCVKMFGDDVRAQSAMLDARFVTGDKNLSKGFFAIVKDKMSNKRWRRRFVRHKYREHLVRLRKFGGSVYVLEPHIKEGEGGLREYHTAQWLGRVLCVNDAAFDIANDELMFLLDIRARLHLASGKRDDRLTFENQGVLSQELGLTPEELMGKYYKSAASLHAKAMATIKLAAPWKRRLLEKWHNGKVTRLIGNSPSWQRLAANIDIIYPALKMMHQSGEFKKFIPALGDIYYKAQNDSYHVYTVDIHSLFTVKKVSDLGRGIGPKPLCSVFKRVKRKDILLLAALLHDVGKGAANKDLGHEHIGMKIARDAALRLNFSEADAEEVSFLVASHLIMPRIAFSRDLTDTHLIENFANSVQTCEILNELFIVAYADISAIGPDVWTPWKERLLCELYNATARHLAGFKMDFAQKEADRARRRALSAHENETAKKFLLSMPDRYFIANNAEEVKTHIDMYGAFDGGCNGSRVTARHVIRGDYSEFAIMTGDAPGIFARLAGVMAASRVNVLEAELNTGKDGVVLDILRVQAENGAPLSPGGAELVVRNLEDTFNEGRPVSELISKRPPIIKRSGPDIEPRVDIDNDVSTYYTVIDVYSKDKMGLLYDITDELFKAGCYISVAKVLTMAGLIKDSFYVKDFNGNKILSKERLKGIKKALFARLEA